MSGNNYEDCKVTVEELEYIVGDCVSLDVQNVQSVLLRYISQLKQIYNFYRYVNLDALKSIQ